MSGSKVWSSPEWRKKRAEFIKGKACEWCGSTEKLTVHHTKPPPKYDALVRHVTKDVLDHRVKEGEFKYQIECRKVCPKCGKRQFYKRTTMRPVYRCNNCGSTFDKIKTVRVKTKRLSKADFRVFWKKYGLEIRERAYKLSQEAHEYYMSFQDCMVLCKKCNFALHSGKVLCKVCRKKYHLKKYAKCWDCLPDSSWKRGVERMRKKVEVPVPCGSKV